MIQKKTQHILLLICSAVLIASFLLMPQAHGKGTTVRIGVLAYRGKERAMQMWSHTAQYLSNRIPGYSFTIVPLDFQEMGPVVRRGDVDFVVTNTSIYVELEAQYGVSRIATMKNKRNSHAYTLFGGVVFCRDDRRDIRDLTDLKRKTFMAVEETSLGGWRMAWREFKTAGIDPYRNFQKLEFAGTHDAVVYAVRDGKVDAGTVRTDVLERMEEDGAIEKNTFRILNQQYVERFPFSLSTRLYPEWPFAKTKATSEELAQKVVIALLDMTPDDPAARMAQIAGWTIPLDYQPVHDLLKELRVGPYRDYGKITLSNAIRQYWYWVSLSTVLLLGAMMTVVYVIGLNRRLSQSQVTLRRYQENLELNVKERTAQLETVKEELEAEIAERIRTEAEKNKLQEQLLQTQKMEAIGLLAGGVAHDFNNILSAIVGYASLLHLKMNADDPLRPNVAQILASAERAAGLTHSLLAFSRKQVVVLKPVNINDVVCGFQKILERLIGEDIEFNVDCFSGKLVVEADKGQLEQVLMNLATNARDAMPRGGKFTIATGNVDIDGRYQEFQKIRQGKYALIAVTDTGVGMDKKIQEHVFEPFFTTKEVGKGTGLGLAMVYGIIKKHNGVINMYSESGQGTTFKIYLPLISSAVEEDQREERLLPSSGRETILVMEDENMVRVVTRAILEEFGYTVIEAFDGEDGIRAFREHQDEVALVLCDLIMPRKNGSEAYEELKKIRPDIKAIFMSGYTADIIAQKGILEGGINFISKPLNPTELLNKIREVLGP